MIKKKRKIAGVMISVFMLLVISGCTPAHYRGAGVGGAMGGVAGALLDRGNPWRGGVIGAVIGSVAGATLTDIAIKGSREAAVSGRPVEYRTQDGRALYRAEPVGDRLGPDGRTEYRRVRERVWEDGVLVQDTMREVRVSEKVESGYY